MDHEIPVGLERKTTPLAARTGGPIDEAGGNFHFLYRAVGLKEALPHFRAKRKSGFSKQPMFMRRGEADFNNLPGAPRADDLGAVARTSLGDRRKDIILTLWRMSVSYLAKDEAHEIELQEPLEQFACTEYSIEQAAWPNWIYPPPQINIGDRIQIVAYEPGERARDDRD